MKIILNDHDFINKLSENIQREIEEICLIRQTEKNEIFYQKGDLATEMYQILKGSIRLCNYSNDGREIVTGQLRQGDCFGEMAIIDGFPRVCCAITNESSQVLILTKKNFKQLYQKHPEISQQLNLLMCRRIRLLYELTEEANTLNLNQRLSRTLYRLSYSHGIKKADDSLYINTSHEELGRMLGASRQSVSKELKSLERKDTIKICYNKIYIYNLKALDIPMF